MPNRLGIDIAGAPRLIKLAMIFDIGVGTVTKGPAIPVRVTGTVVINLSGVRIEKPGLRKLFKTPDNAIQRIIGQFIIMIQFHENIAFREAARQVLDLPDASG